jgi:hypothetical protein
VQNTSREREVKCVLAERPPNKHRRPSNQVTTPRATDQNKVRVASDNLKRKLMPIQALQAAKFAGDKGLILPHGAVTQASSHLAVRITNSTERRVKNLEVVGSPNTLNRVLKDGKRK